MPKTLSSYLGLAAVVLVAFVGAIFLDSSLAFLVLIGVGLLTLFCGVYLARYWADSDRIAKAADFMGSPVYRAVAEKYGVAPNLVAQYLTPEREALAEAVTRCDRCRSIEDCLDFFSQPGKDIDEARDFCPNAQRFIAMAKKLKREAKS